MLDKKHVIVVLEACIELELKVASIYRLFANLFPDDQIFWSQLHLEEKSHASLLRMALDTYSNREMLAAGFLPASLEELQQANARLSDLFEECKKLSPTRKSTFTMSITIENEIGEQHYNKFMNKKPESPLEEVFQKLNRDDTDHARRIAEYMRALPE